MTYNTHIVTLRRIEEDIPDTWQMLSAIIFNYDGSKYILWSIQLNPSSYQQQLADISCDEEWNYAWEKCDELFNLPHPPRRLTGGHKTMKGCMKGLVSARCGGNAV